MKKQYTLLSILLLLTGFAHAQIQFPFHETFDAPISYPPFVMNGTGYQGTSWDIVTPPVTNTPNQSALQLTVYPNSHYEEAYAPRSRSEISFNVNNDNGTTYYYSWQVFIPDNSYFQEHNIGNSFHILQQFASSRILAEDNSIEVDNRKIMTLDYQHDIYRETCDDPDLQWTLYDALNSGQKFGRVFLDQGFKKGAWNEFVIKVRWSDNTDATSNNYGYYQIWLNRQPLVAYDTVNWTEPAPHSNPSTNYYCDLGHAHETPTEFIAPTQFEDVIHNNGWIKTLLKLGHYRSNHMTNHTLYLDNIQVTTEFPRPQLSLQDCGTTLTRYDWKVDALAVPGATNYVFRIEQGGTAGFVHSPTPELDFSKVYNLKPDTEYTVRVRAQGAGISSIYGATCTVRTPPVSLTDEDCNRGLTKEDMTIEATPFLGTDNYHFRLRSATDTLVVTTSTPSLNLWSVDELVMNTQYHVSVSSTNDGTTFPYGPECVKITGPETQLLQNQCSGTLAALSDTLRVYALNGAYKYFWEINGIFLINTTEPYLIPANWPLFNNGNTYSVQLYVQPTWGGTYPYGNACDITISGTSARPGLPDSELSGQHTSIYPNPNDGLLTLSSPREVRRVRLRNALGSLVEIDLDLQPNGQLDLGKLPSGMYFLEIETEIGWETHPIRKK